MANEVRADYQQLQQVSGQFSAQAQSIEDLQQKVRGSYSKLVDKGWIGQAATAFFGEMDQHILPSSDRLREALDHAGQITQQVAQSLKQAEQEASALFKS
jgi:WXG100 family type VII secretion target